MPFGCKLTLSSLVSQEILNYEFIAKRELRMKISQNRVFYWFNFTVLVL